MAVPANFRSDIAVESVTPFVIVANPAIAALGWTADKINEVVYNQGADIYNLGALPLNYLVTWLSGYNPGFSGQDFMQPFATAVGLTEEDRAGNILTGFHEFFPVGEGMMGVAPGEGGDFFKSFFKGEGTVEDSLNQIDKMR